MDALSLTLDSAARATLLGRGLRPVGVTLDSWAFDTGVDPAERYAAFVTTPDNVRPIGRFASALASEVAIENFYSGLRALIAPATPTDPDEYRAWTR